MAGKKRKPSTIIERGGLCYVQLANDRGVAVIDAADRALVESYAWCLHSRGYACTTVGSGADKRTLLMHRLLLPEAEEIDHHDKDRLNNRRRNLRPATSSLNNGNRRGWSRSGYKGVTKTPGGKWRAVLCFQGRKRHLGNFATKIEAALAYDREAKIAFGPFAQLNFVHRKSVSRHGRDGQLELGL